MNCEFCGEVCRCPSESPPNPSPRRRFDDADASAPPPFVSTPQTALDAPSVERASMHVNEGRFVAGVEEVEDETATAAAQVLPAAPPETSQTSGSEDALPEDASAWRDELSARLNRYRSRRKMRPPRYPSLSLQFDAPESLGTNRAVQPPEPAFETVSDHALALDGMRQEPAFEADSQSHPQRELKPVAASPASAGPAQKTAKIIEFPRFAWGPPPPPPDQLAEPVSDRPRILEAPEIVPPPPALGGITIEAAERDELEKRPGIDIPLQQASLSRRLLAGLVDGLIVALASGLFALIFWKVAAVRPPMVEILGLAVGLTYLFWVAYQYLLIVYSGSTPGLRASGLELTRFDGTSTNRRLRSWRVLAACLSGVSLGMGYVWLFLDEDALCWHDRITHTYLAPGNSRSNAGTP